LQQSGIFAARLATGPATSVASKANRASSEISLLAIRKEIMAILAQGSAGVNFGPASASAPGRIVPDCCAAKAGGDLTPIYAADIPIAWRNLI
jgi:hypothetical protein